MVPALGRVNKVNAPSQDMSAQILELVRLALAALFTPTIAAVGTGWSAPEEADILSGERV